MKIDKISFVKTFATGPYLNDKVGIEISLDEGDDSGTALDIAKKTVEQWHQSANPHLYQERKEWTLGTDLAPHMKTEISYGPIPIISKETEKLEIAIDNAETEDQLKKIKEDNPVMPFPILTYYNKRMAELTTGRPQNFTDGLR